MTKYIVAVTAVCYDNVVICIGFEAGIFYEICVVQFRPVVLLDSGWYVLF